MRFHIRHSASNARRNSKAADLPAAPPIPVSRYAVFFFIAVVGCAADLLTKHWVFQWRGMPSPANVWWLWEGYIGIETATNAGALFGMGQGRVLLFAVLSIAAALGILYWLLFAGAARDLFLTIAIACILGGILGNLYDRLGMWHCPWVVGGRLHEVRDWILFQYQDYKWPNFNIADCLLVCGAVSLVLHAFTQHPAEAKSPT